jgi:ferrous iron transport protein B
MKKNGYRLLLTGNSNVGKSTLFNILTGLHRHTGNYPGTTVSKQTGFVKIGGTEVEITDLPGTESLFPHSLDEEVAVKEILKYPGNADGIIYVADVENLKKNLLLLSQILDLNIPVLLVVTKADKLKKKGIEIDTEALSKYLKIPVVLFGRKAYEKRDELLQKIKDFILNADKLKPTRFYSELKLAETFPQLNEKGIRTYKDLVQAVTEKKLTDFRQIIKKDVVRRYALINRFFPKIYKRFASQRTDLTGQLDRIFLHTFWGYVFFFLIMFLMFQSVYQLAEYPMNAIDEMYHKISVYLASVLPGNVLTDLLINGLLSGIFGVLIFVPQIAFLFLFVILMDKTGYMSRVVYLTDRWMKPFGMSGKSLVPLISGTACAVPAIMATRAIETQRERLITLLSIPFTTCAARLPVYTVMIALIIPGKTLFGFIGLKGLTLFLLYILGFAAALTSGLIMNYRFKKRSGSQLIMLMPDYHWPAFKEWVADWVVKVKSFVSGAGKIIVAFSVILWFSGTHGVEKNEEKTKWMAYPVPLEKSYLGQFGHAIEPVFKPLGFDWKIDIAVLSSFAAREIFISTLATIYSVDDDHPEKIVERLRSEMRPSGKPVFDFATGIAILLFYAFALQCMSTLAVIKQETGSWKYALGAFVFMTGLAYVVSFIAYQTLN